MEKKWRKIYVTCYNLLAVQNIWQVHHQMLSIIFLMEFIELNVNRDMMIKNLKLPELNKSMTILSNT